MTAIYQGSGEPAKNLIPPTHVELQQVDPGLAVRSRPRPRRCWPQAGFPNGFETTLWAMPVQRPYNPDARRMAEMMQSDLAKVGITAKIVSYEWGEYRKRVQNAEHDMALLGWTGDNGDPDNFFVPLAGCAAAKPGGGSASKWCNQDFEALVQKAVTTIERSPSAPSSTSRRR